MSKRALKLDVRLPRYDPPRNQWRRDIYQAVRSRQKALKVRYLRSDRLEIYVRLYLRDRALEIHDVDNRLKDVMDALQGHVGGSGKKKRSLIPVIQNDCQIWRVVMEKVHPPWQSQGQGHLVIRKLSRTTL